MDLVCKSGGIPVGVDDPHSKTDINKLLVDLYTGKRGGTMCIFLTHRISAPGTPATMANTETLCIPQHPIEVLACRDFMCMASIST